MINAIAMKRRGMACLSMVIGCGLIFGLVIAMNAQTIPPEKVDKNKESMVAVAPKKKPPKKKPKPKPKRQVKAIKTPRAPLPNLSSALSGMSFGLPRFAASGLDGAADSILGDKNAMRNMVMTEEAVDVSPRPVRRSQPQYPPRARAKGINGKVILQLLINDVGMVERVKILQADPPGVFEDVAAESVKNWEFEPALYQGEKVKVWARQVVTFKLG